jgi:uncharacterized repeat protein (TIGR01451 family)
VLRKKTIIDLSINIDDFKGETVRNSALPPLWWRLLESYNPTCGIYKAFGYMVVSYRNEGYSTANGKVRLKLPSRYNYYSAFDMPVTGGSFTSYTRIYPSNGITPSPLDPVCTGPNAPTQTVEFSFTNLPPGATKKILLFFNPRCACAPVWKEQTVSASIICTSGTESNLTNNNRTLTQKLPYDPNEKTVSPVGIGSQGYIAPNQELTYTIDFQNMGAGVAQNVGIVDTMDTDLDLSTLVLDGYSHDVQIEVYENKVMFLFNDIFLPDSLTGGVSSKGFVRYKVKPKNGLASGTQIKNKASIYFDINPPIHTNEVLNTIGDIVSLSPKVILEGAFNASTGLMTTSLVSTDIIPNVQPFGFYIWEYRGNEALKLPNVADVVDWVLVELRSSTNNTRSGIISRKAAVVLKNGNIVDAENGESLIFAGVPAGNYYVVVRHRNHLPICSANPIALSPSNTTYDFSSATTQVMGGANGIKLLATGQYGMFTGDVDINNAVKASDINLWRSASGTKGYRNEDATLDGNVKASDGVKIFNNSGKLIPFND